MTTPAAEHELSPTLAAAGGPDAAVPRLAPSATRRRAARAARIGGTVLVGAGVIVLLWAFCVWKWGDPITGMYTAWKQRELSAAYAERERDFLAQLRRETPQAPRAVRRLSVAQALKRLDRAATAYRSSISKGDAAGRIAVARLNLDGVIVEGTSSGVLKRGPGRDPRTYMPGEGELVYIAGHRTTYGAPFAHIDRMRPGDLIVLSLPYARLTYRVSGHRIVAADALEVLRSKGTEQLALQACHPRFFASQRYIVDARLASFALPLDGGWRAFPLRSGDGRGGVEDGDAFPAVLE